MALSSAGIGSGLDVKSLVSQLMEVERAPIAALDKKEASYQAKLSTYGTLKGSLAALQTAAKAIATSDTLTPMKANVADASIFSASAGANAVAGTYDVEVISLAQSQKLMTATGYASTETAVGTGDITFNFGTYDTAVPPVFAANADKTAKTITIDSSNNTLTGMRDAINAANMGVSASIINDGTSNILTLTSNDTGARNALQITVSDPSLNALAYDPTTGGTTSMAQIASAEDAVIVVDTIRVTKQSNTITDAIQGVTLNLGKEVPGTTTRLTLSRDTSSMKSALESFVKAYNDTNQALKDATAYNATTRVAASLNGDSTIRTIQTQMRQIFGTPVAGAPSGMSMLSDAGISFQKDGTLTIDATKLAAATADPSKDLSKLFATSDSGKGYGYQMDMLIGKILSPVGPLADRTKSFDQSIKDIGTRRDTINTRLVDVEKRYRAQFTALDTLIASMTTTSNFLTQQLASLPSNNA
ncbi:MAG: flagellar filament capping protein FliD [Burkholderiaceae bacterium]